MVLKPAIPQHKPQRLLIGLIAVAMAIVAVLGRIPIGFSESTGIWASGLFGKVSILLAVSWLAWPQLMWLKQSPSGSTALVAIAIAGVLFVSRPRLLLYAIPILLGGAGILLILAWFQRFLAPPK
jgi:hypothetical protein